MPELPRGTVSFLFTDVEGSTRLWEHDPVAMRTAVTRHDVLLSDAITDHRGSLYKHVGDAVQAAFPTAIDALSAAVAAQRALTDEPWSETGPLRVRMALHVGEAAPDPRGDYHQVPTLNRLSRLLATGYGGQVLLTDAVRQQVDGSLPAGVALKDLGKHRLRDLLEPERISQVVIDGLPAHFPPLRSLERHPTNLPIQPNELIGRDQELVDLKRLLTDETVRLVTLTGPGGTGKTRLALQAAAELLDRFEDGAFVVDLAPLIDPGLVLPTIAATLGVREAAGLSLRDTLVTYLADKQLLLVLDNYEHVLDAAPVAADLLATSPNLRILATSRAPLRLKAEREYPVEPLMLPTQAQLRSFEQLMEIPAVALFMQRAHAVKPDFTIDHETAPLVAEICLHLDGLPLAIELAAARVKLLPPRALLARLEKRLPVLTGGTRDGPTRQRTLRDTIAWSHDLLSSEERALFRRLAVFAGGCTIEAAEAVTNANGDLDVFHGLTSLVDKSLLRQGEGPDHEPRVTMLETIREFAREQLVVSGEEEAMRDAHAAHLLGVAEVAEPALRGPDAPLWLGRLSAEHDNLRAALGWAVEHEAETAFRLAGAVWWFWMVGGHLSEGDTWLRQVLARGTEAPPAWRVKALHAAAGLAGARADSVRGRVLAEEELALARKLGDRTATAWALFDRGHIDLAADEQARTQAEALLEESRILFREVGDRGGAAAALNFLGLAARIRGDYERASARYAESLELLRDIGDQVLANIVQQNLGTVFRAQGDQARALALCQDSLTVARELRDFQTATYGLYALAVLAADSGDSAGAARLLGAADGLASDIGLVMVPGEREEMERDLAVAREMLGEARFGEAREAGRALPLDEAIAEGLALPGREHDRQRGDRRTHEEDR
jgi:predicted ATPase